MRSVVLGAAVLALAVTSGAGGQTVTTRTVMRDKLLQSQKILESIMVSNFDQLDRSTAALLRDIEAPGWAVLNTPEFMKQSVAFRTAARDLREAATGRDLDAAATRYAALTLSCYQCHRYLKGARIARR